MTLKGSDGYTLHTDPTLPNVTESGSKGGKDVKQGDKAKKKDVNGTGGKGAFDPNDPVVPLSDGKAAS